MAVCPVVIVCVPDNEAVAGALIVKLAAFAVPFMTGFDEITLILYAVPAGVLAGIVVDIVPLLTAPKLTGEEKLPEASDSWAVKVLPALKVPVVVYVPDTVVPAQKVVPVILVVTV